MSITNRLNDSQREAVTHTEGPLLIIAGPGSGKTFTLVERIVYLITKKSVKPENLLVVTFTDKAASELTTRISNRLYELDIRFNLNEMYLGTFHSICLRWLEEYREFTRLKRSFTLMDEFDQQYFLYKQVWDYKEVAGIEHIWGHQNSNWRKSEALLKWLNTASEEALDAQILLKADDEPIRALGRCYTLYQQQLEEANALDFSTIQYEALKLLRNQPEIREALQQKIRYMMVDEYQDTNTIQELILTELAGENPNLCVVGDDDQGLYRFRGATIRNILQFADKFPQGQCHQVKLTVNYRSHPHIIGFYNQWQSQENWTVDTKTFRYAKTIEPRQDIEFPQIPTVIKVAGENEEAWHKEVFAFLNSLRDHGQLTDWNQVAFLFRSVKHEQAVGLAQYLESNGIAVYSPRSNQFFEREEVRLMIGALIALFPQFPEKRKWSNEAHLDIWNYYDNDCFRAFALELRKPENDDLKRWIAATARIHLNLVQNADYAFAGLFYELLRFPLFSRYLNEERLLGGFHDSRPMRNLAVFSKMLNKFEYLHNISVLTPDYLEKNIRDLFNQFFRFLQEGGINEYEDVAEYAPSGSVSFLTIHQAKGLEFPVVMVGSLYVTPRKQYGELDEILERGYLSRPPFEPLGRTQFYDFRRLYYTAFSRAQNLLVLTYAERQGRGAIPSKPFAPLCAQLISWRDPSFRPQDLPLSTVKEIYLKAEYSFTSHLTLFENCAEQYRFFKELDFAPVRTSPILFGTLVHQTIEDIHKTVLRGNSHKLSPEQIEVWFDTNYTYLTKRERVYLAPVAKQVALNHVLHYYERNQGNWSHIRDTEVDVSLVKDRYILSGKIDLIVGDDGGLEIVDFKSEKKLDVNDPNDREKLDRYRRQLEVYAHIVEERRGVPVNRTHLYYTGVEGGNPRITFNKDERSIERTIATFNDVVERIESQDFRISERPTKLCGECDMRHYCDRKNWRFRNAG